MAFRLRPRKRQTMGTNTWTAEYAGSDIRITNHYSLLKWETWESIEIDDVEVARNEGSMWRGGSVLHAKISVRGTEHSVIALIGNMGFSTGCHIYVDGLKVGGDTLDTISFPAPDEWRRLKERGMSRFLLFRGFLLFGLPFATMMYALGLGSEASQPELTSFLLNLLCFGGAMGGFQWGSIFSAYRDVPLPVE